MGLKGQIDLKKLSGMRKIILLAVLVLSIMAYGMFHYGRGLWYPYYIKITGGKTVEGVAKELRETYPDIRGNYSGLILYGMKEERMLEVWGETETGEKKLIRSYSFTGYSGTLGPKLREGDGQIPEGIYRIEYLNPNSSYHLSMKLNYPNDFDKKMGQADGRGQLGYDIFIHGKSVTVGCIPIGDEAIEELFLFVHDVGMDKVKVILAPHDFRKNDKMPEIEGIDWEHELYEILQTQVRETFPER